MAAATKSIYAQATSQNPDLTGALGDDILSGYAGASVLAGGGGNDTYYIKSSKNVVVEAFAGGIDTVYTWIDYQLSANVENLYASGYDIVGIGNALDNVIIGGDGRQQLYGAEGNDTLTGGIGNDTFIVRAGSGSDTIVDFEAGVAGKDLVSLRDYGFKSFLDVVSKMTTVGDDTVLRLSATETLTFKGHSVSDFSEDDFQYSVDTSGLKMTFSDDFDTVSLQHDGGTWKTSFFDGLGNRNLSQNGEQQIYIDKDYLGLGVDPFTVQNGILTIHADKSSNAVKAATGLDYTSGLLSSRDTFSQTYGYFEIRTEMPAEQGTWPAFWLLPANGNWPPEIDVFENLGNDSSKIYTTAHTSTTGVHTKQGISAWVGDVSDGMHTYGLLWTAKELVWYVDGNEVFRTATPADMNQPMYLVTNLAIGGYWPGNPDASFTGADMNIDYIRAYQFEDSAPNIIKSNSSITLDATSNGLVLTGSLNVNGKGNSLDNTLVGTDGDNILDGGAGADVMTGNGGNDRYYVDNNGDVIIESTNGGTDSVFASVSYKLADNVENLTLTETTAITAIGNNSNNTLTGNDADNIIIGGMGADLMLGGKGDDTYYVDNLGDIVTEWTNAGKDTVHTSVSFTLGANIEELILEGKENIDGTGNNGANSLVGNSGNNVLNGGGGSDVMAGGAGNDNYYVDNVGDVVVETANGGIDTIFTSVTYTLSAEVENLTLSGTYSVSGYGNTLDNVLIGNDAANILDGGTGADKMSGGNGNDRYYVDHAADIVNELAKEGDDTVYASVSHRLSANVEALVLTGSDSINAIGNELGNTLTGNDGNNVLDGGAGIDFMAGGKGDDTYYVSTAADIVTEWTNAGNDTVHAWVTYTLGSNLENLVLLGAENTAALGNNLANSLTGNSGDNVINGYGGVDKMAGGLGNDMYFVDSVDDLVIEAANAGNDIVYASSSFKLGENVENLTLTGAWGTSAVGNDMANVLVGNSAANILNGGLGADSMSGGLGNDTYYIDNTADTITEWSAGGVDLVYASASYTLSQFVENLTMTGDENLHAAGNWNDNVLLGNNGNNILDGDVGNDTLKGGGGNDVLIGGLGADILMGGDGADIFKFNSAKESVKGGFDTIMDFRTGDKIDLSSIFSGLKFVGDTAFTGALGELAVHSNLGTITVFADLNGDTISDFELVIFSNQKTLGANDFLL